MRIITLLGIIVLAWTKHAYSSCHCSEPTKPDIPSGYYAEQYQMNMAKDEVETYLDEIQEYKNCLVKCIDEANSDAEDVIDEWNSAVQLYNNR